MKIKGTRKDGDLKGTDQVDVIRGLAGNDVIHWSGGADKLYGGDGDDYIEVRSSGTRAFGESGDDRFTLIATAGSSHITVDGGTGVDYVFVNAVQVDLSLGYAISDVGVRYELVSIEDISAANIKTDAKIVGSDDANQIELHVSGDEVAISVDGRGGDDTIIGERSTNTIFGGDGDDTVLVNAGYNTIDGGSGHDFVSLLFADYGYATGLTLTLDGDHAVKVTSGSKLLGELTSVEDVEGGDNGDQITGDRQANLLDGGYGNDRLSGKAGNDTIIGGAGVDTLIGGSGADTFVFRYTRESSSDHAYSDTITDFSSKQGDKLSLTFDADVNTPGTQHFVFIGNHDFSDRAGEIRFDSKSAFVSADTNGDGVADISIKLAGVGTLTASDFIL